MKEKKPQKGPGRSRFTYHMPSRLKRQAILSLEDSYIRLEPCPSAALSISIDSRSGDAARKRVEGAKSKTVSKS